MATRSRAARLGFIDWLFGRGKKRERSAGAERRAEPPESAPAGEKPAERKTVEEEVPPTIQKGIYISALVYIEGEQAPAENFSNPAKAALREVLEKALGGDHAGLTMTLKKLEVRSDVEEDEGEGKGGKAAPKEKFEF